MKEKSMRSTKMIVFALLNETGGCFLDPGLGLLVEHPLDQSPKRVGWNGFRKMGTRMRAKLRSVSNVRVLFLFPAESTRCPKAVRRSTRRSRTYGARYEPVAEDVAVSTRFRP